MKGHLLITEEKWIKFLMDQVHSIYRVLAKSKNLTRMQEVTVPFWIQCNPPQQLESQMSLWSLLKRKALEIQDVQVVCHLHNVQSTPQQWCPHQVIKAPQMQVAKCNYHNFSERQERTAREERILCSGSSSQRNI